MAPVGNGSDVCTRAIMIRERVEEKVVEKQIMVAETDATPKVNLIIEFDTDSCAIRPVSYTLLDELGQAMDDPALTGKPVMIIGHADADGPDAYNLALSMNRALAIKYYLQGRHGIAESRVRAVGFGEAMPIAPNNCPLNKQKNRRVEVRLDQGAW
jgi:OOP family OmpA-OmpF porin